MMKQREGLERLKGFTKSVAQAALAAKDVVRQEIEELKKGEETAPVAGYFGLQSDAR